MSEKPIIFSGPMVRAILAGRKTQTRRVKKKEISPYSVGDLLWVREAFCAYVPEHITDDKKCAYKANATPVSEELRLEFVKHGYPYKWHSPIHMPRWASRIFLRVTDVRLEMLQDIGEDDAKREGVEGIEPGDLFFNFMTLWETINAKRDYGWETNSWVWVISFEVVAEAKNVTPHL
jgi:hypothetical protein